MIYSDLNAILLGEIVRRVSGAPLLRLFVSREVFAPLGLAQQMLFGPRSASYEDCSYEPLARHPIAGIVNDPSAYKLGGVTGNAGLFCHCERTRALRAIHVE